MSLSSVGVNTNTPGVVGWLAQSKAPLHIPQISEAHLHVSKTSLGTWFKKRMPPCLSPWTGIALFPSRGWPAPFGPGFVLAWAGPTMTGGRRLGLYPDVTIPAAFCHVTVQNWSPGPLPRPVFKSESSSVRRRHPHGPAVKLSRTGGPGPIGDGWATNCPPAVTLQVHRQGWPRAPGRDQFSIVQVLIRVSDCVSIFWYQRDASTYIIGGRPFNIPPFLSLAGHWKARVVTVITGSGRQSQPEPGWACLGTRRACKLR